MLGGKVKKLLAILVLGLLWCSTVFSVESLIEGQKGTIKFESIPVVTLNQFLKGETIGDSVKISGKLKFPKKNGRAVAQLLLYCMVVVVVVLTKKLGPKVLEKLVLLLLFWIAIQHVDVVNKKKR